MYSRTGLLVSDRKGSTLETKSSVFKERGTKEICYFHVTPYEQWVSKDAENMHKRRKVTIFFLKQKWSFKLYPFSWATNPKYQMNTERERERQRLGIL